MKVRVSDGPCHSFNVCLGDERRRLRCKVVEVSVLAGKVSVLAGKVSANPVQELSRAFATDLFVGYSGSFIEE